MQASKVIIDIRPLVHEVLSRKVLSLSGQLPRDGPCASSFSKGLADEHCPWSLFCHPRVVRADHFSNFLGFCVVTRLSLEPKSRCLIFVSTSCVL